MATAHSNPGYDLIFEPIQPGEEALMLREPTWTSPWADEATPELEGDVLSCSCPECGSPMSVRLWLRLADCHGCGVSIEMTDEMEREARRHLEKLPRSAKPRPGKPRDGRNRTTNAAMAAALAPTVPAPTVARPKTRQAPAAKKLPLAPVPKKAPLPAPPTPKRARRAAPVQVTVRRRQNEWLRILPACLISMMFHTIMLVLLGLWILKDDADGEKPMNLQVAVGKGELHQILHKEQYEVDGVKFEMPVPEEDEPKSKKQKTELIKANDDAKLSSVVQEGQDQDLPDLSETVAELTSTGEGKRTLAGRDPRVRSYMVRKEGGTTNTEAAVARGLRWLAQHQHPDGHWSFHNPYYPKGMKRYPVAGNVKNDVAATSLGLLPYLGAGQTNKVGIYTKQVDSGLRWLLAQQKPNGDLRGADGHSAFYAHGLATIVLCEAYSLTRDPKVGLAAQRAIDFIAQTQHVGGGWRYKLNEAGDTSVVGWQLMAMHSAKAAGLNVPKKTLSKAKFYLDTVQSGAHGGLYSYVKGKGATNVMTAEGLLCRMYLGWTPQHEGIREGSKFLMQSANLPNAKHKNMYYYYYGTQAMKQIGGSDWERWNSRMRNLMVRSQEANGPAAGSWTHAGDKYGAHGGRLFTTSLAICTLEVYYRHLPLYRKVGE